MPVGVTKVAIGTLALLSFAFAPSAVSAWGYEGHQIIAFIAADRLTPAARSEMTELLGGDARETMLDASVWADQIRPSRRETAPWHYVNIEIEANGYSPQTDCPTGNCVVAQVQKAARIVADHQLVRPVRAEALRFLLHFVGDLHQPLHCADNQDRGGNEVRVAIATEQTNLHAVWDTDVVAALGQDPRQIASTLEARITPEDEAAWSRGGPVDWANESFGVARRVVYAGLNGQGGTGAPIILPFDYATSMRTVTATQLDRAGVRLALLLNKALNQTIAASPDMKAAPVGVERITPETAAGHVGETATVGGIVAEVFTSRSGVTILDMGARYPDKA